MAILNKIRQQSLVLIVVIAMALFAFIFTGIFTGDASFSGKSQDVVGSINGEDISRVDFLRKVEIAQNNATQQASNSQIMNGIWEQEVRKAVMGKQLNDLGISVERDYMRDLLKTSLSTAEDFKNEDGIFDENKLNEFIANLKAISPQPGTFNGNPVTFESWTNFEEGIATSALQSHYNNLVKAGLTATQNEGEIEHKLEGDKVDIKFIQVPFASIPDSTITISDSDVNAYVKAHSKKYEVDATTDIQYVEFKEVATTTDEDDIKKALSDLLDDTEEYDKTTKENVITAGFKNATDNKDFINAKSDIKFNDAFLFKSNLSVSVADSISNLNVGETYGPYKDGNYIKIDKVIAVKQLPDSTKARHILIPFIGSRSATAETTQTEAEAKTMVDSLVRVLKSNKSKFVDLAKELSADKSNSEKGGELDWFNYDRMVAEFRDYAFNNNTGDIGVAKTIFGFHIIDIQEQKNKQQVMQLATLAREIQPSDATIDKVFADASNFELAIADKNFQEVAKESNYTVKPVDGLKGLDETVQGLGNQRSIVQWSFNNDTKVGDFKRFNIPNGFAIAQLVAKHEEGLMNTEKARITATPELKKEKKAKLLVDRISATTLETLASAETQQIRTALALNMKTPTVSGVGREPKVVGAAFALKEGETSKIISGDNGVYMIQVTKITPAPALDNYQAKANQISVKRVNEVDTKLYNALKEASEIDDNRANTVQ